MNDQTQTQTQTQTEHVTIELSDLAAHVKRAINRDGTNAPDDNAVTHAYLALELLVDIAGQVPDLQAQVRELLKSAECVHCKQTFPINALPLDHWKTCEKSPVRALVNELTDALEILTNACLIAVVVGNLSEHIDGGMLDAANALILKARS